MNGKGIPVRQIVLAYALLLTLLISAWSGLMKPAWDDYRDRQSSIETQRLRLERLEHAVASDMALDAPASKASIDALQAYVEETSLVAPTADIGGSLLQQRLTEIVEGHSGAVGHTRISGGSSPSQVTVSMHFTVDLAGLEGVLYDLAAATPFIFVDVLSIRGAEESGGGSVSGTGRLQLAVQIDAAAFWIDNAAATAGS